MRHAVEQFTTEPPAIPVEDHPYDGEGMIIAYTGNLTIYLRLDRPGEFYTDMACKHRATDAQARAAFGADVDRYRAQAQDRAADARIEAALAPQPELEDLKPKANRLARKAHAEHLVRIQHEADLMITRDLDEATPQA